MGTQKARQLIVDTRNDILYTGVGPTPLALSRKPTPWWLDDRAAWASRMVGLFPSGGGDERQRGRPVGYPEILGRKERSDDMYKVILIHEILPGKLAAMKDWCKRVDAQRREDNPSYTPFKRWVAVYGNVFRFMLELDSEEGWDQPSAYAESTPEGLEGEFLQYIVPGKTELQLYKELALDS